eukprot:scaffold28432_cov127-Isochrysis_galbana.AAC.1
MLSMAKGKSPGPDGLGAEFYHSFYALIAPRLHSMLLEAQNTGSLPEAFSSGDISVLYKKGGLHVTRSRGGVGHRSRATVFRVCEELEGKPK